MAMKFQFCLLFQAAPDQGLYIQILKVQRFPTNRIKTEEFLEEKSKTSDYGSDYFEDVSKLER